MSEKTAEKQRGRPFKKGQSGNPNGRPPKGYSITETFKEMFKSDPDIKRDLAEKILEKARKGDVTAQKLIWNYMDGMPKQGVEVTGADGGPIDANLTVTFVKP